MSKHNDLGFVEDPHESLGFVEDTKPYQELSTAATLGLGAAKGATMSFADELAGAASAAPELLSLDTAKISDAYTKGRDKWRALESQAQEESPWIMGAGELAGGIALPLGAIGAAGKGALASAKLGGVLGAATGLGSTEDITDVKQVAKDVGTMGAAGAVLAPAIDLSLGALKGLGKSVVEHFEKPAKIKAAFEAGTEGVPLVGKKNVVKQQEALNKEVQEKLVPTLKRVEAGQESEINSIKSAYEKQLKDIETHVDDVVELEKKQAITKNQEDLEKIVNETVDSAEQLQKKIHEQKNTVKKQYDYVDDAAYEGGVRVSNKESLQTLFDQLSPDKTGLDLNVVKSILKKFKPIAGEEITLPVYRQTKKLLNDLTEHENFGVRKAASDALKVLRQDLSNAIDNSGMTTLKETLNDANIKWTALNELDGHFIEGINANRLLKDQIAENKTIRTIKSFGKPTDDISVATERNFSDFMRKLFPDSTASKDVTPSITSSLGPSNVPGPVAPPRFGVSDTAEELLAKLKDLGKRRQEIESFKPEIATAKEKLTQHPEYQSIKQNLEELKPEQKEVFRSLFGDQGIGNVGQLLDKPGALDKIQAILKSKRSGSSTSAQAEIDMEKAFKDLSNIVGPEESNTIKSAIEKQNKNLGLAETTTKKAMLQQSGVLGWVGATAEAAGVTAGNLAGLGVNKFVNSDAFIAQIPKYASAMASKGMTKYANMLEKIGAAPLQKQRALMYTLLQEPEFREAVGNIAGIPIKNEDK